MSHSESPYGDLLSVADRAALLAAGTVRRFTTGETLFQEGDRAKHVMFIERGRVKVVAVAVDGREAVLAIRGPGELVGEFAVLDDKPRSAGVHALEPVEARVIPASRFRLFLQDHPAASAALFTMIVGRLRESDRRRLEYAAYDVTTRVVLLLLELTAGPVTELAPETSSGSARSAKSRTVNLSQRELAGATGASREAVVKALGRLRTMGIVTTRRGTVTVHRLDLLREIVESNAGTAYPDAERGRESE